MDNSNALADKVCEPCRGGIDAISEEAARTLLQELHPDWELDLDKGRVTRRLEFKGFAKAVYHANLAAFLADAEGHHPDIAFGWGYCEITFTTHEADGLTENDFVCAAKFDRMIAGV